MATMKLGSKAETFQQEGLTWRCMNELTSDFVIEVGEMSFFLHKERNLQKLISEFPNNDGKDCILQIHDMPGGAKAFELVAKFCYDIRIELNAFNVVCLRCADEYLRMTEDYVGGNLIMQTENFLNEVFGSWKDSIKALEACESVLPQAEELQIISRCINLLATKACTDPSLLSWPMAGRASFKSPEGTSLWNGLDGEDTHKLVVSDWWYEDASFINLPLFKRLILAIESKGMKPENIAGALVYYARRFLPRLTRNSSFPDGTSHIPPATSSSAPSESDQNIFLEEIVELLPVKKGVTSTKFILDMLRTSMVLHASPSCRENLERRIGAQLDEAALEDLLIPSLGYSAETLYDIDCIQRILDHFLLTNQASVASSPVGIIDDGQMQSVSPSLQPLTMVVKLMDGYLAEVASAVNLKLPKFQVLASAFPDYARPIDDGLYRANDIFLKIHPWLTESEREQLCRLINCQKLSLEACTHAAQNERLPLRLIVQVLFFEQLRWRTSIAGWFFVSDSVENTHGPQGNIALQKNNGGATQPESYQDQKEDDPCFNADDMRLRVLELEKECSSMKNELEKMGKMKSSWNIFARKCSFGTKSQS